MSIQITQAQPEDAAVVATLVGELLCEIMAAVSRKRVAQMQMAGAGPSMPARRCASLLANWAWICRV